MVLKIQVSVSRFRLKQAFEPNVLKKDKNRVACCDSFILLLLF